ncbi:MAG: cytochrome c1 [Alphaproteobacteria bacterium]|nr:cytochrome c1 [Alphaproteobacteria bacterium]
MKRIITKPIYMFLLIVLYGTLSLPFAVTFVVPVQAAEGVKQPAKQDWGFDGLLGTFDRNALRRGYKVYQQVCAACHGMKYVRFRNLAQAGGPEFTLDEVKAIAAEYFVEDGPDLEGNMFERPALPRDRFIEPYPNEETARAVNNGALPPDLSLIVKARAHGADYIYAILMGYEEAPPDMQMAVGYSYNPYMSSRTIAMTQPLFDDLIEYTDGTQATQEQMARDVVTFLAWAAEPEMEARKKLGLMTIIYLLILTGLLYFSMRKVWHGKH